MIERLIYTLLLAGFEAIKADPTILEEIFDKEGFCLDDAEVEGILTYFGAHPPLVVQGYANANHSFPLVAVILGNENGGDNWIGDFAGQVDDPEDPDVGAELYSMGWDTTYQLLCYAEHPDVTRYLYEIVKTILLTAAKEFANRDVYDIQVSGLDLMPDERYIPDHLFVRQYTFACKREVVRVDKASKLGKAFKVSGIHTSGPNSASVGVEANVTVTAPGDE